MKTNMAVGIVTVLVLGMLLLGAWLYPMMPETFVSHWDAAGKPNGTMPKAGALFFVPLLSAVLAALLFFVPRLDPLRKNILSFRSAYDTFIVGFVIFMTYVHGLTLLWNTGTHFDMGRVLLPALGVGFYGLGLMLQQTKRNWFIGIRTPWTMSSDAVWAETHRVGSRLFEAAGVLAVGGAFLDARYFVWFLFVPICAAALGAVIYSYVLYRREHHHA